jgi:hypothetical protein
MKGYEKNTPDHQCMCVGLSENTLIATYFNGSEVLFLFVLRLGKIHRRSLPYAKDTL